MCLNVWKRVGVGIIQNGSVLRFWLWDLVCKFQSTCVVITDFLCWEFYISIFISSEFVIIFFMKSSQDPRVQGISGRCFLFTFLWLSLQKGNLFSKTPLVDLFTTISFISLCRIWLHFESDAIGSGCAVYHKYLWGWQWKQQKLL